MNLSRVIRCVLIAVFFAAFCVLMHGGGPVTLLAVGVVALMVVARSDSFEKSGCFEFFPWLLCTFSFVATILVLSPFVEPVAVSIALCLCSPLFGTTIYTVELAVGRPTSRAR